MSASESKPASKTNHSEFQSLVSSLKESLLTQKSEILNKNHEFKVEQSTTETLSEEADAISQDISKNISIHLHERDRVALYMIEKALGKISDGAYGQCESCGQTIGARRLQARPFTALCIECMEEQEDLNNSLQ